MRRWRLGKNREGRVCNYIERTKKIMRLQIFIAAVFASMVFVSCSTTNFTEYRGQSIVQGKGGTIRRVDGVDFWENGDPDRNYKILGVIDDTRGDASRGSKDEDIAKVARDRGGDAVILLGSDREMRVIDGNVFYKRQTKVCVVKYINP
jgi:hypothetical protein